MSPEDVNNSSTESRSSAPHLTLYRCGGAHSFFFPHEVCPVCGAKLEGFESSPDGVLVSHTTVWVSPTGTPFNLGLARVACGAQTLCIVDGELGADPGENVVVLLEGGIYHARSR